MIRRDLSVSLAGVGGGQLLLLIAMPFLARAYGPAAFGSYAVVVAIAGVIATVAALRLDLAVVSATDDDLPALVRAAFALPVIVAPLSLLVLALGQALVFGGQAILDQRSLLLVGSIALFQGLAVVGAALGTRLGAFPTVAVMKIVQPLGFALAALFVIHELSLAMALGWIIAVLVSVQSLRGFALSQGWRDSWSAAKRMWRFPAVSMPMALLDALALALPLVVIATIYGDEEAGNYSQVQRLIGAPLTLIAMAGSQVFVKYAGDRFRAAESVMPLIGRFVALIGCLACFLLLAVVLVGDPVLQWLIGEEWRTDTRFLILALLPIIFRAIASPVSSVLILTHRIFALGAWQFSYFLTTAGTLFAAARWLDFEGMLLALVINELALYTLYLTLSFRVARQTAGRTVPVEPAR